MSTISIRQATPKDTGVIARFNALMAEETEQRSLNQETLRKGVEGVLRDSSKGTYYVADIDGRIVGQLMITYEWSDWRNANFWWIQSVYVEKEYRGKRVFTSLFQHILELAKNRMDVCGIRLYVENTNTRAQKVYEQLGMHRSHYEMFEMELTGKPEVGDQKSEKSPEF
ncbi:MAG TPA: GNAT family N-acetyltransferase [Bacteroidota bacterium]|nr:GNAT family N-acetyltransferase [Bacteroidota bacterium]